MGAKLSAEAAAAAAACLFAFAAPAQAAAPPASAFGRLPAIEDAAISADGSKVALLSGVAGRRLITIAPVDGKQAVTIDIGEAEVDSVAWAGNDYVLVRTTVLDRGTDMASGRKYAYHLTRDFVLSSDGKVLTYLLKDNLPSGFSTGLPILRVLDGPKPTAIVQGLEFSGVSSDGTTGTNIPTKKASSFISALWRVDIATGAGVQIDTGNLLTDTWAVDASGQPRVRVDYDSKLDAATIFGRPKSASGWKIIAGQTGKNDTLEFLGYSDPEDAVYLLQTGQDGHDGIVRYNLVDGSATPVPFPEAAQEGWMIFDPHSSSPVGVAVDLDQPHVKWLDPAMAAFAAKLDRAFPGKEISYVDWSRDRRRFLIRVQSPDAPPVWYFADAATNGVSPISSAYPELDGAAFGKTSWITYKARDGLEIPAYLTLPPGAPESGAKLPLIVMPHGGPAARDTFGFDWWAQFLATRGYAVLRPEYRGSAGFGAAFEQAGRKEWAGKMQSDLLDGVAALAAKGVIDPDRVCIVGASYGGYAALAGATLHPEAYRCAVSVNGVADLGLFQGEQAVAYGEQSDSINYWRREIGSAVGDPALIDASSPMRHADGARGPILLVAASNDTTVPYEQSAQMKEALDRAGKAAELVTLQGDDHDLSTSAARTQMLQAVEAFLAKNLPASP